MVSFLTKHSIADGGKREVDPVPKAIVAATPAMPNGGSKEQIPIIKSRH